MFFLVTFSDEYRTQQALSAASPCLSGNTEPTMPYLPADERNLVLGNTHPTEPLCHQRRLRWIVIHSAQTKPPLRGPLARRLGYPAVTPLPPSHCYDHRWYGERVSTLSTGVARPRTMRVKTQLVVRHSEKPPGLLKKFKLVGSRTHNSRDSSR